MPARKTKGETAADTGAKVRAEEQAAADGAAAATVREAAVGAADVTRGEDEAAAAAAFSALSDAAARRGARDAAEGAAALSMADEVAAGGELAAALSTDDFRRGMELAGIAGQVWVAAELVQGVRQPTLAAFLGRTSQQLRSLAVDALSRATEGAIVAHGAEHLAGELAALGLTEMGEGRHEYATSEALGAASAEMAAAAVRSAAAGAAELAAAKAMGGMAQALANDGADRAAGARGADQGPPGKPRRRPRAPRGRRRERHPSVRPASHPSQRSRSFGPGLEASSLGWIGHRRLAAAHGQVLTRWAHRGGLARRPAPSAMRRHVDDAVERLPLPSSPAGEMLTWSRRTVAGVATRGSATGQEVAHDREGW